jgi:PTS system glucose-specific IIC component
VVGNNLQAIFGTRSENLKSDIEAYLRTAAPEADLPAVAAAPRAAKTAASANTARPETLAAARSILRALGGEGNVSAVQACAITRLRVKVRDAAAVSEAALRTAGAAGLMRLPNDTLHVVVGPEAEAYAAAIQNVLASGS